MLKTQKYLLVAILLFLTSGVITTRVATAGDGQAKTSPRAISASTDLRSFKCLEGVNNQGRAEVKNKDNSLEVAGAIFTPFPLQSNQSSTTTQVRLYIPKEEVTVAHGSAMLGYFGKNKSNRLLAYVCFNLPDMKEGNCLVGFIGNVSKQVPLPFETWHTMKMEIVDGLARMKIWADGTKEPDWMIELSVESSLETIDGVGIRTYGQPVLFDGFSASGVSYKESFFTVGSEVEGVVGRLRNDGSLRELKLKYADAWQTVEFRQGRFRGPGFGKDIRLKQDADKALSFSGTQDAVHYQLGYAIADGQLQVIATVTNKGDKPFAPERLPLVLGVDSFMNSYPRWNNLYFPTLFRCEPTHLWGYMMTPHGRILGVASHDPLGSYTIEYQRQMYSHHIYTISLDLLQEPPVPGHHPAYTPLAPGKTQSWTVSLMPIENLDAVKPAIAASTKAPMLELYRYTLEPGQPAEMQIFSHTAVTATITTPAGTEYASEVTGEGNNDYQATFADTAEYGDYHIKIQNEAGKISMGRFFVRPPWSWYLKRARLEALRVPPKADTSSMDGYSCENYYQLLGFYLASKHAPDPAIDSKGDKLLEKILSRLFKKKDGLRFSGNVERIQNGGFMISLLIDRYEATGDIKSLEMANEFAEYLLSRQHTDGYYGGYGMANYNAVIYPGKALMELMAAEKKLAKSDPRWKKLYDRHYASVNRAIDHMVASGRDVKTEGSGTFEDGAVACTATQIAMFALLQDDPNKRKKYAAAARQFINDHACLARLLDTDTRSIGGTARWWEAWNDVKRSAQMMTSPHGWAGWRLYGVYYLYLLTGEEEYLQGVMNSLGSCIQLLEWPSGRLRQAFVIDPHVHNIERRPDPKNIMWGKSVPVVTCEDYIDTIGDWWAPSNKGTGYLDRAEWGWSCDGIPYEIFKAMEEIAVASAYVIERQDGSFKTYNCKLDNERGTLTVMPAENLVSRVHLNLKKKHKVKVKFGSGDVVSGSCKGMQWIGPGGVPKDDTL